MRRIVPTAANPGTYAPDIQARTTGSSIRNQIVFTTTGAFVISYLAKMKRFRKQDAAAATLITGRSIVAWFALLVILSAMSDFQTTQELAVAFAWLVFLSALFVNGPAALNVILREIRKAQNQTRPEVPA